MPDIKLYTTPHCPYCTAAKRLLNAGGFSFEETDVAADPELRAKLSAENNGYRTVPMIFIDGKFIGGFTELASLQQSGGLTK